jgi:hypothetical protein
MNDLRAIISSALLGTERSPLGQLENPHLEAMRQHLEPQGKAQQLLGTAMLALNLTRAGQTANSKLPQAVPAAKDVREEIPQAARERLQQLFAQQTDLIPEWLELANNAGFRVPHQDVISLLDYGRQHLEQRQNVLPLLDSRGRWLAQQNPHWAWAMGDTSSLENSLETWEIGSKAARVLALQTIRENNPEQARILLEQVWKSEPADERKSFLSELENKLSQADEPFLESCLDDRSKEVKSIAALLLSRIKNSAYNLRMANRAKQLLQNGKKGIEIILPEWTNDLSRDGIEKTPPHGIGEKTHWWQSIIGRAPIEIWHTHLQLTALEILKQIPKMWRKNFIDSILLFGLNGYWANALLEYDAKMISETSVMAALPIDLRQKYIQKHIFSKPSQEQIYWTHWMPDPWDLSFSQSALEWILLSGKQVLTSSKNKHFGISFHDFKVRIHLQAFQQWKLKPETLSLVKQLEQMIAQDKYSYAIKDFHEYLQDLISTLETRAAMRKELQP